MHFQSKFVTKQLEVFKKFMDAKNMQLENRRAIITGANQGLGFEIAKKYVSAGASIMMCARDEGLLRLAALELIEQKNSKQIIAFHAIDVSKEEDVKKIVDATLIELGGCDILVNNAGIYGSYGRIEDINWDEWVRTIQINLFGSVLMCRALLPHFKKNGNGKIIQLSGGGATNPLPMISAYATSKAGIIRFIETIAEENRGLNIDINAIAPGSLNTRLLKEIIDAGPGKVGKQFYENALKQDKSGGTPLEFAANLAVFLGSSKSDGISGKLISAVWDDWECFPNHLDDLTNSDIYTIRRIAARDRGFSWGDK